MKKHNVITGQRATIPQWLSDPEGVAPCMCGEPFDPRVPTIMATSNLGLKRWFHMMCFHQMMDNNNEDQT